MRNRRRFTPGVMALESIIALDAAPAPLPDAPAPPITPSLGPVEAPPAPITITPSGGIDPIGGVPTDPTSPNSSPMVIIYPPDFVGPPVPDNYVPPDFVGPPVPDDYVPPDFVGPPVSVAPMDDPFGPDPVPIESEPPDFFDAHYPNGAPIFLPLPPLPVGPAGPAF